MEATLMKLIGAISTAVLSLILAAPAYAQQEQHDQEEEKKPAQDEKKAQPEKSAKQDDKGVQQEKNVKPEEKNAKQENNAKPEEKNAKQENNAKPEEKNAKQENNAKPEEKTRSSNAHNRSSVPVATEAAPFPLTVTRPTLDRDTRFVSPKAITTITDFNTEAIPLDLWANGQPTGFTRKTFMSSILTVCTTCVTRCIPELTLRWRSHSSRKANS
jgi:DNA mismatch repair ATPase MutL